MEQYTAELLRFQYVISDLALFCRAILGVGTTDKHFSGVCRPNFTKLGEGIGRSFLHKNFVSSFRYLAAFSDASSSKLRNFLNDATFRTF